MEKSGLCDGGEDSEYNSLSLVQIDEIFLTQEVLLDALFVRV